MTTDKDDLEPIEPGTAQELFLDHKATDCTDSTVQNHRYRLNPFVRWCGENGIDNLNDLTGRDLQRYRLWRKEDGDLNKLSLRMQMSTLRVFLKWAGSKSSVEMILLKHFATMATRWSSETGKIQFVSSAISYLRQ